MSTDTPNRRTLLTGATAGVAATALDLAPFVRPAAAQTAAEHPDAVLLALGCAWEASCVSSAAMDRRRAEAESRFDRLDPIEAPAALFWRSGDERVFGESFKLDDERSPIGRSTGRRGFLSKETMQALMLARECLKMQPFIGRAPPSGLARLDEVIAAAEGWHAQRQELWISSGMEEIERADEAVNKESQAIRWSILQARAQTFDGITLKLRVALNCFGSVDAIGEHLASIDTAGGEDFGISVLHDLVRMRDLSVASWPARPAGA